MLEWPATLVEISMMKLKKIATSFIFTVILNFTNAQPPQYQLHFPTERDFKETKVGGGVAHYDSKGNALFSIGVSPLDSNTTFYYPNNSIYHNTNFSYFTNSALLQVSFSVYSSIPIENMLYSITTDKDSATNWRKLDGRFVRQNEPNGDYTTNIFLEPLTCRNEIVTIKLYDIKHPEAVLSQIVSTVPIEKPVLFSKLIGYNVVDSVELNDMRVARRRQKQKNLENARLTTTDILEFQTVNLFLNTDNSPYVYSVFLIRTREGRKDTIPVNFIWAELNNKIIRANKFIDLNKAPYKKTYNASIPLDWIKRPGNYELLVVPAFMKSSDSKELYANKTVSIKCEIRPSTTIDIFYVVVYSALFLLTGFLLFAWYKRKQKQRIQQQQQLTKEAKLKLEAVRSQLNPHFIFNALAGIQNLMNKNETVKAHNYLSSFSRITRSVLDNSAKELISVDEEIEWLKDYLEMEQLRFGFQYAITVDKELDKHNVEIPVMLLQPFVENAIRHGIPERKENGRVAIRFRRLNNDMHVSISDNGKGFDATKEYSGAGLSLSKNRVALLNTIYKHNLVQLTIDSTANGTEVVITLNNWL